MSYVIGTRVRVADRAAMIGRFGDVARPKLEAAGATNVRALDWLTGDGSGVFTGVSEWESLNQGFAALEDFYADPEVGSLMQSVGVEVLTRMVGVVEASVGSTNGAFAGLTTFAMTNPDPARFESMLERAMEVGQDHGLLGFQLVRMFAGGAGVGAFVVGAAVDDLDAYPKVVAAATPVLAADYEAMGATVVDRLLVRSH